MNDFWHVKLFIWFHKNFNVRLGLLHRFWNYRGPCRFCQEFFLRTFNFWNIQFLSASWSRCKRQRLLFLNFFIQDETWTFAPISKRLYVLRRIKQNWVVEIFIRYLALSVQVFQQLDGLLSCRSDRLWLISSALVKQLQNLLFVLHDLLAEMRTNRVNCVDCYPFCVWVLCFCNLVQKDR